MKPKFNIGDIVSFDNDFNFNSGYETLTIGKIEAIHIHRGNGIFVQEKAKGTIIYTVSGGSQLMKESALTLVKP